ncbi:MAG: phosphatidate cytidylyltransferase [Acidobacteriota bacterium]
MGAREATAFTILPVLLAAIVWLPPWVFLVTVWAIAVLAAWELLAILRRLGHPVPLLPSLVGAGVALPVLWYGGLSWAGAILACQVLAAPILYLVGRFPLAGASAGITGATFISAYFTVAAGGMGLLRTSFAGELGWKVVLIYCVTVWAGDSGAYYVGSRFGRHRLAPRVSPKKSWEGVLGGTAVTFLAVWICRLVFFPELSVVTGWLLAALLSVVAPVGDLAESLFKRDAGVKDSSDLIPGHGGFLDRTDSLFFGAPFVLALFLAQKGGM